VDSWDNDGIPQRCSTIAPYPRNLEVRGEYFSSGIWTRRAAGLLRGKMVNHGDLELPEELAAGFTEWLRRHDLHGRKPGFNVVTFDAMGLALSKGLQDLVGPSTNVRYATTSPLSILGWIRSHIRPGP
jgi:hypothetical protein